MYVTITKKKYKDKVYEQILLRESYRDENGKVKNKTVANLTKLPKEQVEALKAALSVKTSTVVSTEQSQGKIIGLSFIVVFIMNMLNIVKVLGKSFEAKIALMLIVARIVIKSSRIQALKWSKKIDNVLDILKFSKEEKDNLDDKTIYTGLDYLFENKQKIENKLFKLNYINKNKKPKRLYYDVTSSYVEGDYANSKLVRYGYNRDKKINKKQIVIGLLTDEEGRALSCDVYPGNTNDFKTFKDQLQKIKKRFVIPNITIVGDKGMISSDDIELIKKLGFNYITSISKDTIKSMCNNNDSQMDYSLFDENLKEFIEDDIRYILKLNPIKRLEKRNNRVLKIQSLKDYINNVKEYYNTHYKARKQTLQNKINNLVKKYKLDKFVKIEYNYEEKEIEVLDKKTNTVSLKKKQIVDINVIIDEEAKKEVELLDGCYVIKTSLTNINKDTKEDIHQAYKDLIKVENAFKILKTDFLQIRPLYLKTDNRIVSHVFLSMLAYNVVFELKRFIKKAKLDFKSTIKYLNSIKTVINKIGDFTFITIPKITDSDINKLLDIMNVKFPERL